jgi:hypothetical protein
MYAIMGTASDRTFGADAAVARALRAADEVAISFFGDSVGITGPDRWVQPDSGRVTSGLRIGIAIAQEAGELRWRTTRVLTQAPAP